VAYKVYMSFCQLVKAVNKKCDQHTMNLTHKHTNGCRQSHKTSNLLDVRPSRCVLLSAIGRLLLPTLDFGTVYLLTSSLPRHLQHFVKSWKLIYFVNLTQTLCY